MPVLFRRIRGRAAGHVIVVNPALVRDIEPTRWGGSDISFSDVHSISSRDDPQTVADLLEGRTRLCRTALCDQTTIAPICSRCQQRGQTFATPPKYEREVAQILEAVQ